MAAPDDTLRAAVWADELSSDQLQRVRADTVVRHLRAGGYACCQGEPAANWIGVISGMVKLSVGSAMGKATTLTEVTTGGWFGEGSLLKDEPRKYDGIAVCDTRIACIPRSTFMWLLDTSFPFNRFLLNQFNERLGIMISMLESTRLLNSEARVARCVATLFNPLLYPNAGDCLDLSQEEIGYLCGMSRQRVNRALHTLEQARLLRVEHRRITVIDLPGLQNYGL